MKAIQYFTRQYLQECKKIPISKRLQFLEDFRKLQQRESPSPSKLISLRIPEDLLRIFRQRCAKEGKKYQTKLKELMKKYCTT